MVEPSTFTLLTGRKTIWGLEVVFLSSLPVSSKEVGTAWELRESLQLLVAKSTGINLFVGA